MERAVHVLRTGPSLANRERRRCMEERKWAVSQGNIALASMKREVARYTALMQSFKYGRLVGYRYTYIKWADGEHISVYQLSSSK